MREPAVISAYHRRKLAARLIATAGWVTYAAAWTLIADRVVADLAGALSSRWLVLLMTAGLLAAGFEILTLPLSYYRSYIVERAFELSEETRAHWLRQRAKGWIVGVVLGGVLLIGLYGLLWYGGAWWWAGVWGGWLALSVVLAQLFPVLILPIFYPATPVEDPALGERLAALAKGTGIRIDGVYNLKMADETKKANAMLTGLGATRRVYFTDTLLAAFSTEQIEVVFAHELGHHVRGHIWKGLAMSAVAASAVVGVMAWLLGPYAGSAAELWPAAVATLPAVLLAVTLVQMAIGPIANAISRHFERQCDRDALTRTGNPQAYREAFETLGHMNLSDPTPPRIVELLFYDHPALSKRLAMAIDPDGKTSEPRAKASGF
jgi:STE24 endopeptidase